MTFPLSWIGWASGWSAAIGSVIAGSGSYVTAMSLHASRAVRASSAATSAIGSPMKRTFVRASGYWSLFMSPKSSSFGRSSCVSTARTPGSARALVVSIDRIRACGCGLRSVAPCSIPCRQRSLAYSNSPFTFGGPSGRWIDSPTVPRTRGRAVTVTGVPPRRAPLRGSSRSRCSGRCSPTAPRGSPHRSARDCAAGARSQRR